MLYRIITMGILHLSLTVCTDGNPLLHALVWLIFRYFGELARSVLHTARDDDDEDFFFFFLHQIQSWWMFALVSLSILLIDLPGSA